MTQPTDDQLAAAAQKARADHETAREIAARLLAPPDPVDILAGVIADRGDVADERDELQAKCDALTAERDDLRAGLSEIACCFTSDSMDHVLSAQTIVFAIADLNTRVADLSSFLSTAEEYAETQRTAAADLRDALDRVATAAGFGPDGAAPDIADRVIDAIRRLSRDRDQVRVARKDAAEDLERLNAILSSAGIDTTGPAADVADRVAAALLRPALPADKNTATTTENNTVTRMQAAVDAVSVECSPAHADRLRAAWAETQELLRGWQAIAAGYQEERNRALDALDRIDTAIDEHKTLLAAALVGSRDGSV